MNAARNYICCMLILQSYIYSLYHRNLQIKTGAGLQLLGLYFLGEYIKRFFWPKIYVSFLFYNPSFFFIFATGNGGRFFLEFLASVFSISLKSSFNTFLPFSVLAASTGVMLSSAGIFK